MAASGSRVANMVSVVVIYCFCLFKQKNVFRADVSINTNMYGLKPAAGCGKRKFARRRQLSPYTFFYQCFSEKLCARRRKSVPEMTTSNSKSVGKLEQLNLNLQAQSVRLSC
jgi:hypothetical protein